MKNHSELRSSLKHWWIAGDNMNQNIHYLYDMAGTAHGVISDALPDFYDYGYVKSRRFMLRYFGDNASPYVVNARLDSFTLSFWVWKSWFQGGTSHQLLTNNTNFFISCTAASGYIAFRNVNQSGFGQPTKIQLASSTWTHITFVSDYANNTVKYYRNGIYIDYRDINNNAYVPVETATITSIGGRNPNFGGSSSGMANGYLNDIVVFNRPMKDGEVRKIYDNSCAGWPEFRESRKTIFIQTLSSTANEVSSGGIDCSGTAVVSHNTTANEIASGGIESSGTTVVSNIRALIALGGIRVGGSSQNNVLFSPSVSGGTISSGSAINELISALSGGVILSGTASVDNSILIHVRGGYCGGEAEVDLISSGWLCKSLGIERTIRSRYALSKTRGNKGYTSGQNGALVAAITICTLDIEKYFE